MCGLASRFEEARTGIVKLEEDTSEAQEFIIRWLYNTDQTSYWNSDPDRASTDAALKYLPLQVAADKYDFPELVSHALTQYHTEMDRLNTPEGIWDLITRTRDEHGKSEIADAVRRLRIGQLWDFPPFREWLRSDDKFWNKQMDELRWAVRDGPRAV